MVHLLGALLHFAIADVLGHEHQVGRRHVVELPQRVDDAGMDRGRDWPKERRCLPQ
jgi:hypothetical protein